MNVLRAFGFLLLLSCSIAAPIRSEIIIDYTYDLAGTNFFGTNPTADAALQAALGDINQVLDLNLGSIAAGQDVISGAPNASLTATFDFDFGFVHPTTGAQESIDEIPLGENQIRLFVGTRNLADSTLGVGGAGSYSTVNISSNAGFANDWPGAIANGSDAVNAIYNRGEGPVLTNLSGASDFDGNIGT